MIVEKYLQNLIEDIKISPDLGNGNLFDDIYKRLTSAKYRTHSLPIDLDIKIKNKINYCLKHDIPLYFTVPFGGYKLYKYISYPHLDWAEVFNLIQLRDYLFPLSKIYPKGVILEYWSDEILVSEMNKYDQKDLDTYNNEFNNLIKWFSQYLPDNFEIRFAKIRDRISYQKFWERVNQYVSENVGKWDEIDEDERQIRLTKAKRNMKIDLNKYSKEEQEKILKHAALLHDAFIFGNWKEGIHWAFEPDMIALGFRYTRSWGIPILSSRSSYCQFWIGYGALRKHKEELIPTILTFEQYQENQNKFTYENVNVFPQEFCTLQKIPIIGS